MYKVFAIDETVPVEKREYQIFWCPSAPHHYEDKVPHSKKIYKQRQGAYRRCQQLQLGKARDSQLAHKLVE